MCTIILLDASSSVLISLIRVRLTVAARVAERVLLKVETIMATSTQARRGEGSHSSKAVSQTGEVNVKVVRNSHTWKGNFRLGRKGKIWRKSGTLGAMCTRMHTRRPGIEQLRSRVLSKAHCTELIAKLLNTILLLVI